MNRCFPGLYLKIRQSRRTHPASVIERILQSKREVIVVQVGSNDGSTGDPIYDLIIDHQEWRGIFIEPVPYLFDRLQKNYGNDPRFIFENVAIADREGKIPFYFINPGAKDELKCHWHDWYEQLGSFQRKHIEHLLPTEFPSKFITECEVDCLPLSKILALHTITTIDLLHIDTEGYDLQVLLQMDLQQNPPHIILIEHKHLTATDKALMQDLLSKGGFENEDLGSDFLAIRRK